MASKTSGFIVSARARVRSSRSCRPQVEWVIFVAGGRGDLGWRWRVSPSAGWVPSLMGLIFVLGSIKGRARAVPFAFEARYDDFIGAECKCGAEDLG
jgi:hypothetical protein